MAYVYHRILIIIALIFLSDSEKIFYILANNHLLNLLILIIFAQICLGII